MNWNKVEIVFSFVGLLLLYSCSKPLVVQQIITDPAEHHMKFIPENPGSNDEIKLVIFDDCNYNTLAGLTKNGNTIEIKKQFNSLMKRPCFIQNDTIIIGKLAEGTYTIHYQLMDIARTPPVATLSLYFILPIAR